MSTPIDISRRRAGQILLAPIVASLARAQDARPWRVLLFVAHPDDEYYFAATVYRLAQELNAVVDQVVVTNGEGGYRYSALAEKIYGMPLTDERTGRSRLPEIRRKETLAAGRILGIRNHYFFDERDERFTLDATEADGIWNCASVRERLRELLEREQYDFIFTLLPRAGTHGHHKAATLLALDVVSQLEPALRPVVLGAEPAKYREAAVFRGLDGFTNAETAGPRPEVSFNRRQSFGYQNALSYDIVVQWVVAEHKSQGMFQNDLGRHDVERFWRFGIGPHDAAERVQALALQLRRETAPALRKVAQQ